MITKFEIYEIKGNYLTKKNQPKNSFDPYLYDNGFGDRYYICTRCNSHKLTPIPNSGFSPPNWKCDNCGEFNYSPMWLSPKRYWEWLKQKEIDKEAKKFNL